MLVIHAVTVIFVSQLPETKGSHMGPAHHPSVDDDDDDDEDLALREEEDFQDELSDSHSDDRINSDN